MNNKLQQNASVLEKELKWFSEVLQARFNYYFHQGDMAKDITDIPPPKLSSTDSLYSKIINHYPMSIEERLVVLLALAPHIKPQLLDMFFTKNAIYDRGYTEFGGISGHAHNGFLPTGETAIFLLAGDDLEKRMRYTSFFENEHFFYKHNMLKINALRNGEPILSSPLSVTPEYLTYFTTGGEFAPAYSSKFPAKRLTTKMEWEDLILEHHIFEEVEEILAWVKHNDLLMEGWGLGKILKPGYRTLFHGPPGTGKTLTASLLGKSTGLDVYRIDLSQIVSKYIGETEKNLAGLFDLAENKNWILFFDEADALFGKRTATKDSKDRHANQEVAYLLQRMEDFPGVIILASNLKGNIDDAFARRFQSMIYFPIPSPEQRYQLWKKAFSEKSVLEPSINLEQIADSYELAGGSIINIVRYCSLSALRRNSNVISLNDLIHGIRKEFRKEGKTV